MQQTKIRHWILTVFGSYFLASIFISAAALADHPTSYVRSDEEIRESLASWIGYSTSALRRAIKEDGADSARADKNREELKSHQVSYRIHFSNMVSKSIADDNPENRASNLSEKCMEILRENDEKIHLIKKHVSSLFETNTDESFREKILWESEAQIRVLRLNHEACYMLLGFMDPKLGVGKSSQGTNIGRTYNRLHVLAQQMANNNVNDPTIPNDGLHEDMHRWYAKISQDINLDEYRRYAAEGMILDKDDKPVEGAIREEISYYAELSLASYLDQSGVKSGYLASMFYPSDSRLKTAEALKKEVVEKPENQIFNYVTSGITPSINAYFKVLALIVRKEQEKIDKWMIDEYNAEWYNTGLGTVLRANGAYGTEEAGYENVKIRIHEFHLHANALAEAFEMATEKEPDYLKDHHAKHYHLLESFGYIKDSLDGKKKVYTIPDGDSLSKAISGAKRDMNLPGAPLLNVINPKEVGIMIVTSVVPGAGAASVAKLANLIRKGQRLTKAGKLALKATKASMVMNFLVETSIGTALDVGIRHLEGDELEIEKALVDSLLLGSVLQGVNIGTGTLSHATVELLDNYRHNSQFKAYLSNTKTRKIATEWLSDGLGLTSETALTSYYQAHMEEKDIDFDTFLSVAINGALSRIASNQATHTGEYVSEFVSENEFINKYAPEFLKKIFITDPKMARQMYLEAKAQAERLKNAEDTLLRLTAGDKYISVKRILEALNKGELTLNQMRDLYSNMPKRYEYFMVKAMEMREIYVLKDKHAAQKYALRYINETYQNDVKKLKEKYPDQGPEYISEYRDLSKKMRHDLRYFRQEIIAPGSKTPTSDIDRSSRHPLLVKLLRHFYETRTRELNSGQDYVPPSAKSMDVNEYYNVMPFVESLRERRSILREQPGVGGFRNHDEVMAAYGLAASMQHMTKLESDQFVINQKELQRNSMKMENIAEGSDQWQERQSLLERQFTFAKESLARGEKDIKMMMDRMGLDPKHPDSKLLVMNELYQERIESFHKKVRDLDFETNEGEANRLRAEMERDMSYMLREGIETYSGALTLDVVVNMIQKAKVPEGDPRNMMQIRLEDPEFVIEKGKLKNYSRTDADTMINDQVFMMVEHINGKRTTGELPFFVGKALAKYGQRVLLALKIRGDITASDIKDPDSTHPLKELQNVTASLMKFKGDPEKFKKALENLDNNSSKTVRGGLEAFIKVIDRTVPGMKGIANRENMHPDVQKWKPSDGNPFRDKTRFFYSTKRRLERHERQLLNSVEVLSGNEMVAIYLEEKGENLNRELEELRADIEFLKSNPGLQGYQWEEYLKLKQELEGLETIIFNLPYKPTYEIYKSNVEDEKTKVEKRIAELEKLAKKELDIDDNPEYRDLMLRMYSAEISLEESIIALKEAREKAELEALYDKINLTGVWKIGKAGDYKARAKVTQTNKDLVMWISSDKDTTRPPQYKVVAKFIRGRILGSWEYLHSPKIDPPEGIEELPLVDYGVFEAKVPADGVYIQIEDDTDENDDNRSHISFRRHFFYRSPGQTAPSGEGFLRRKDVAVKDESKPIEIYPSRNESYGRVYFTLRDAGGKMLFKKFTLYKLNTFNPNDFDETGYVADGETGRRLDFTPGHYDIVLEDENDLALKDGVEFIANQSYELKLPRLGRIAFNGIAYNGGPAKRRWEEARVYKGEELIGTARSGTPLDLKPGLYKLVFNANHRGKRYSETINVKSGKESQVNLYYGAVQIDVYDGLGKKVNATVDFYHSGEDEGSIGGSFIQTKTDKIVDLAPALYNIRVLTPYISGSTWKRDVLVSVENLTKLEFRSGRLNILVEGKPLKNENGVVASIISLETFDKYHIAKISNGTVDLPTGKYKIKINHKGKVRENEFTVSAGKEIIIKF